MVSAAIALGGITLLPTATCAESNGPVTVSQKAEISVNKYYRTTSTRDGRGAIDVFPLPAKPISHACKRVDIAVVPYADGGFGAGGGEVWTKGGCEHSSARTISAAFKVVGYAKERAEGLCRRVGSTQKNVVKEMTVPFLVKRRYCFLDMEGEETAGGTKWSVDCETDADWIDASVYYPITVSCERVLPKLELPQSGTSQQVQPAVIQKPAPKPILHR